MTMLNLNKIKENKINIYKVKEDCFNLIYAKKGKIILPHVDYLCQLRLLFINEGDFEISAENDKSFKIGLLEGKIISHHVGKPGYDTQPSFVFIQEKGYWVIISIGLINFKETEESIDQ